LIISINGPDESTLSLVAQDVQGRLSQVQREQNARLRFSPSAFFTETSLLGRENDEASFISKKLLMIVTLDLDGKEKNA
jgi:hypothetical protein